jgi:hypothetical protein
VQLDSSATVVRGAKEFDWVITPARSGEVEVPQIRYPFFNPYTERYELAVTTPQRVSVAPGSLVAQDASPDSARPVLPLRRVMLTSSRGPLSETRGFWIAMLVAPVPAEKSIASLLRSRDCRSWCAAEFEQACTAELEKLLPPLRRALRQRRRRVQASRERF